MKKLFFVLLAGIAMTATAQNTVDADAKCPKGPVCSLPRPRACKQDSCFCPRIQNGQKTNRHAAVMNQLSEADRATVKEIMTEFHKEHKAIQEKCRAQRPAKGVKLTDKQKDELNKARIANRTEVLKLKSKYYDKLRKVLSPEQASRFMGLNGNRPHHGKANWGKGHKHLNRHHASGRGAHRAYNRGVNKACNCAANCPRLNK